MIYFFYSKINKIDVLVETEPDEKTEDNYPELIPDVSIQLNKFNELNFSQMITEIKNLGFDLDNNLISYWSPSSDMFVICGKDPLPKNITMISEDFKSAKWVKKIKKIPINFFIIFK